MEKKKTGRKFVLIIGAMKSGTTSLFGYLSEHPEIARCKRKEPNFFSGPDWRRGYGWYERLWGSGVPEGKLLLEASTFYTKVPQFPNAAERIAATDAEFKFIYIMRNPIDRIESHYTHMVVRKGVKRELEDTLKEDGHYINTSRYAKQLDEYYKRFPPEDILLLNFEDLKANPDELMRRVCRFLSIDPSFNFRRTGKVLNKNKGRYLSPRINRLLKAAPAIRHLTALVPSVFKKPVKERIGKLEDNFKFTPEQRALAESYLADDLRRLAGEYGIDLSSWGIKL
ncbi:MAG: sulfotransferase [Thermodesulfobacteriota bacterium]